MPDPTQAPPDSDVILNAGKYADPTFGGSSAPATAALGASPTSQGSPAVWTLLGEAKPSMPRSMLAVGSTIYNRQQTGGYSSPDDVVKDPYNGYEAWQTPATRASLQQQYPPGSQPYNAAQSVLTGLASGQTKPLSYDTYYNPTLQAQDKRPKPSFDDGSGDDSIGDGNRYFTGKWTPPKMTPEQQAAADAVLKSTGGAAPSPGDSNNPPGTLWQTTTPTQQATMLARRNAGLFDFTKPSGDDANPWVEKLRKDGTAEPLPAGAYVDLGGQFHPGPRSTTELVGNALTGLGQGLGIDTAASGARLGLGGGDPLYGAISQAQGGPSALAEHQAALQGFGQEQANYALRHAGEPEAQAGRFVGQAIPATAAAAAVPELEAPSALGRLGTTGARLATNALRGTAAATTNVGANQAPIGEQLAAGAITGGLVPEVVGAGQKAVTAITGLGRTVAPNIAELADAAQSKYGIPLQSGQVAGPKFGASDTQRQQWMRAVTGTYGDPTGNVAPEALQASRERIGGQMDQIASRNAITDPDALQTRLGQVVHDAQGVLSNDQVKPLLTMVKRIGDVRDGDAIPGEAYQALTSHNAPLDRLQKSADPNVAHYASQIRDALDDALEASAQPGDVSAFQNARFQYKNLMTVAKAAPKQDAETGVIPGSALQSAIATNFKNRAFQGAGDLGELAQIHQNFLAAPRAAPPGRGGLTSGLGFGLGIGGGSELAESLIHGTPDVLHAAIANAPYAAAAGGMALAGKTALNALARNKNYGSAAGIVSRSLPGTPGSPLRALGNQVVKPLEVPLSALMGVRLAPANAQ